MICGKINSAAGGVLIPCAAIGGEPQPNLRSGSSAPVDVFRAEDRKAPVSTACGEDAAHKNWKERTYT